MDVTRNISFITGLLPSVKYPLNFVESSPEACSYIIASPCVINIVSEVVVELSLQRKSFEIEIVCNGSEIFRQGCSRNDPHSRRIDIGRSTFLRIKIPKRISIGRINTCIISQVE